MTTPDLDALAALADAATADMRGYPWAEVKNSRTAPVRQFIAAANPATVKALIAEIRKLREAIAIRDAMGDSDDL